MEATTSRPLPVAGAPSPIKGRGVAHDPPNRFERLHVERDEWTDADDPAPRTRFLRDRSRTILARNHSPDVGFEVSVNPYRGCEHGCVYCLRPETPVLRADLVWQPIGDVAVGDVLVGFDEYPAPGKTRKLRRATVEAVWRSRKPTYRLITERTEVVTTAEHRWLQSRDFRWSRTDRLGLGRTLRYLPVSEASGPSEEYRRGYIGGMTLGDGTFRFEPNWRSDKLGYPAAYWRVALADYEPLDRLVDYLNRAGIAASTRPFQGGNGSRRPMRKVEVRSLARLARLYPILRTELKGREYRRGFLAGFFDAEGHHGSSLRMSQRDLAVLERIKLYAQSLGFSFVVEERTNAVSSVRLVGSISERMRFLSVVRPAIRRKLESVFGRQPAWTPDVVEVIEAGAVADVVDIQTSTGTFVAAGLATHNCYARPNHEYLGFSPGLDFESKILVKEDAPKLLRKALSSPRWKPQVIAFSGVTDPYQPVERRLEITRRCLEVARDFRNPVSIITKSHLVTRDIDVLQELAGFDAAHVTLSVTSLRREIQRVMEPRAAIPERRLAAIEALSRAGIGVGVNVAPVVPGLTDHEMPAILEAAAQAGATRAGYILLRLPFAVKEMFDVWLEQHFPDRAAKVLNRLTSLHDGKLYDGRFGVRQRGGGPFAAQIRTMFEVTCTRLGLNGPDLEELSAAAFRRPPAGGQGDLFDV